MTDPRETVAAAIWAELRRQAEEDTFGPCVVPSDGVIDGIVDMGAVAAAVVEALGLTEERGVKFNHAEQVIVLKDDAEYDDYCDCIDEELHAPSAVKVREFDDWDGDPIEGPTSCGIGRRLIIPGIGSRMGCQRCEKCCEDLGLPPGTGSPKNDQACRELLGMVSHDA